MKERIASEAALQSYRAHLIQEEKSAATIAKYMRDVEKFLSFAKGRDVDKMLVLLYKEELRKRYAPSSANSMLAALSSFFSYMGWTDCKVKQLKVQKKIFCPMESELTKREYFSLLKAASGKKSEQINLIMQTICSTGIRISELGYITAEALRCGQVEIACKGKIRAVFLSKKLKQLLEDYAKRHNITSGPIFITAGGRPVNRSNVWKRMKKLCRQAKVNPQKVYPHNLRHLFARCFYSVDKDICKLADVLGHTSIETTRIYIISSGKEHEKIMSELKLVI